ncbi:MAG: heavy metal-binding domain-containing protein [Solirubrobacteraceae bacterium]|jgi:uncharacterized protein YbjQ (UPF0145 family)
MSPLFRRPQQADPAAQERAQESMRRLEAGGIPVPASERLATLAGASGGPFGSDLAVEEYALLERLGIAPVTLVMGSSIYHVGFQGGYAFQPGELSVLSHAYNECRRLALGRLLEEASTCGADAVVGVRITQGGHDWAPGAVEFIAVGTAVRLPERIKNEQAVLTDLSGQDYWKLCAAGMRPVGIAGHTSVHYVPASWQTQMTQRGGMLGGGSAWTNQELRDFTQGVYAARETAMRYLDAQARQLGGDGVVGVKIDQRSQGYRVAGLGYEREDMIITFNVIGTVIREEPGLAEELAPASLVLSLS